MSEALEQAVEPVVFEPLPLLYEDPWLAVVNKPAGLMVHDSKLARGEDDFLADRLREIASGLGLDA